MISASTYFILNFIVNDNKEKLLQQTTTTQLKAYNSILYQYNDLSDVIFSGLVKFTKVDEKLFNLNSKTKHQKDEIRRELYLQTINRFNSLKEKNILSINYILPDNTIFLKMVNPLDYGQKVTNKRETINFVQENKTAISSYEIGQNGSGYRFVYPLIKNDIYLGLISLTFREEAITQALMKQYDVLTFFVIDEKLFDKDFLKKNNIYQNAEFEGFLYKTAILNDLVKFSNDSISEVKPSKKILKEIYDLGQKKDANSIYIDEKNFITTIIPIFHKISKEYLGFISIISKGNTLNLLENNYYTILFLFLFLYLSVTLLFLQQKINSIIDKEHMQKMMKKDQQLLEQAKMAQMGEMIGNIAHQWRQPLSAISTLASGTKLNYEFGILKNEDITKNMQMIVDNTKYLSKTIDTFRDFIKEKREEKEIIIQDKIDETINIIQATLDNNHIKLIKNINYTNKLRITMIPEELTQVIINILNNAKDAIIQKKVHEGWIKISLKTIDKRFLLFIEDNAGGISEENLPKIFDPYFTTKHQFQGTGLGLYMSKVIVEKHLKGKIKAHNTKNGALFTVELPLD